MAEQKHGSHVLTRQSNNNKSYSGARLPFDFIGETHEAVHTRQTVKETGPLRQLRARFACDNSTSPVEGEMS